MIHISIFLATTNLKCNCSFGASNGVDILLVDLGLENCFA
jgi:hypothetical protein